MICPKCQREMIYNAILKLYYCIKEHQYYQQDKDGKLKEFHQWRY